MAKRDTEGRQPLWTEPTTGSVRVRPAAKALVTAGDSVLLVREHHADGSPFWTLPGGGVCPGESLGRALERELGEELLCRCVVGNVTTAFPYVHSDRRDSVSVYAVCYCWLLSPPKPARSEGVTAVRWGRPGALPEPTLPQVRSVVSEAVGTHDE
jgi:8-oxo-dGTP diphosphatase